MVTDYGLWGRMPLPSIPICPQEPWEAQEEAHRDRSRVNFSFRVPPGVETRLFVKYFFAKMCCVQWLVLRWCVPSCVRS